MVYYFFASTSSWSWPWFFDVACSWRRPRPPFRLAMSVNAQDGSSDTGADAAGNAAGIAAKAGHTASNDPTGGHGSSEWMGTRFWPATISLKWE